MCSIKGNTVLHSACEEGDFEKVVSLIKTGANINAQNEYGVAPIHFAVRHAVRNGDIRILECLLENKADIDIQNNFGETALHWCVSSECCLVAKLLMRKGANALIRNNVGDNPYHFAVKYNYSVIADLLKMGMNACIRLKKKLNKHSDEEINWHSPIRNVE